MARTQPAPELLDAVLDALRNAGGTTTAETLARNVDVSYDALQEAVHTLQDAGRVDAIYAHGETRVTLLEDTPTRADGGELRSRLERALDLAQLAEQHVDNHDLDTTLNARLRLTACGLREAIYGETAQSRDIALSDADRHLTAVVEATDTDDIGVPARNALELVRSLGGGA